MVNSEKNDFQDPYIDQSSGCLHNLLGIKDSGELCRAESALVLNRAYELGQTCFNNFGKKPDIAYYKALYNTDFDKTFDLQHLQAIHRHLFQDVYEWAGQIRKVDLSKGDTYFLPHPSIEKEAAFIFDRLKHKDYLEGLEPGIFSIEAAYCWETINRIHPFREGNGRTQREFINQLAHHNNYHIEWKNITPKQMIEASIASKKGYNLLAEFIHENLVDRDVVLSIRQNPSYGGRHVRFFSAEAGKNYEGSIIGVTERQVMQASKDLSNHVIIHDRYALSRVPEINKTVEISYPHGDIGLVREPEMLKEKDSSKTHGLEKDSQQHEWER